MAVSASCFTRVQRIIRIFFSSPRTAGAVATERPMRPTSRTRATKTTRTATTRGRRSPRGRRRRRVRRFAGREGRGRRRDACDRLAGAHLDEVGRHEAVEDLGGVEGIRAHRPRELLDRAAAVDAGDEVPFRRRQGDGLAHLAHLEHGHVVHARNLAGQHLPFVQAAGGFHEKGGVRLLDRDGFDFLARRELEVARSTRWRGRRRPPRPGGVPSSACTMRPFFR